MKLKLKFKATAQFSGLTSPPPSAVAKGANADLIFKERDIVPLILWDSHDDVRRCIPMRWGFPKPGNWKASDDLPLRVEDLETDTPVSRLFNLGQRGILLVNSFELASWDRVRCAATVRRIPAIGVACLWQRFQFPRMPNAFLACAPITMPIDDPAIGSLSDRVPALLAASDWAIWLGQKKGSLGAVRNCLDRKQTIVWTIPHQTNRPRRKSRLKSWKILERPVERASD